MRPPKPNIEDFAKAVPFEQGLSSLLSDFENWEQADGRGKMSLWALLGKTYEFANQIEKNNLTRVDLLAEVSKVPGVAGSNRWRPQTKHAFDLLLVLLLGLKEDTKATKSQWLRTLKAAQAENVASTQEAFSDWIENIGGVAAALKLGKKPRLPKKNISEMAKDLPDPDNLEDKTIEMPLKMSDDDLPDGFGLVIVKKANDTGGVVPIGTIVNERQVSDAIRTFLADQKRQERKDGAYVLKMSEDQKKSTRRAAKAKYYAMKQCDRPTSDFEEYLAEYKIENPNEDPQAFAPMHRR